MCISFDGKSSDGTTSSAQVADRTEFVYLTEAGYSTRVDFGYISLNDKFTGHGAAERVEVKKMRDEDRIRNPKVGSQKGHEPILTDLTWPRESTKNMQITKRTPLLTCGFTRGYRGGHQKPAGVDTVPELMMTHPTNARQRVPTAGSGCGA